METKINQTAVEEQVQENVTNNGAESYDKIIRKLIATGSKRINGLKIKNVNFSEEDNYIRVSFTINQKIAGMIIDEETGEYKEGVSSTIFTSTYALAGMLKEDENLGWLANTIIENPTCLNVIFNGATIDVLSTPVEANTTYKNPFSTRDDSSVTEFDHKTYINNVIKIKLSPNGQRMADILAVKMMGF